MNSQIGSKPTCAYRRQGLAAGAAMLATLVLVGPVCSAPSGYVGTRAGLSDDALTSDENSVVGELFGGVRINDHWAVELGFFGTDKDLEPFPDTEENALENNLRLRGAALSARYTWPLSERLRLHLRAGLASFDLHLESSYIVTQGIGTPLETSQVYRYKVEDNNIGAVLALGVDTAVNERWRLGVELQHYRGDLRLGHGWSDFGIDEVFNKSGSLQAAMLTLASEF